MWRLGVVLALSACASEPQWVTVYNGAMKVSVAAPRGWSTESGSQAGFLMQNFKEPGTGVVFQVMAGPLPEGASLDDIALRYGSGEKPLQAETSAVQGASGKTFRFPSARLLLVPVENRLYGVYAHGPAERFASEQAIVDAFFRRFSIEEPRFFQPYERPELGLRLKVPSSWSLVKSLGESGKAFFVSFRSPPLGVDEQGTTVHATLEVNVSAVEPGETLESFYAKRVKMLGDAYRLVEHERVKEGRGIADLYASETQLASYLEKTVYFVEGGKSYVFKFNVLVTVFHMIEPWVNDITSTFDPFPVAP